MAPIPASSLLKEVLYCRAEDGVGEGVCVWRRLEVGVAVEVQSVPMALELSPGVGPALGPFCCG